MKHEWKKKEKELYLPPNEPVEITVPEMNFFCISGRGNPNDPLFGEYIQVLYSLSYGVRMSYKSDLVPSGYYEYTVYPLEGEWDLSPEGRASYRGSVNKDELIFTLMIRQPNFVTPEFAQLIMEQTEKKKPHPLLGQVHFKNQGEEHCVQMMHIGSYDAEPASFARMEKFCSERGLIRKSPGHREIYISDFRKTPPEKLNTVLRFGVI